jgi:hypothetical protein
MPTKYVRFKGGVILRHPDTGAAVVPAGDEPVDASDPLVKAYPWAFASDDEIAEERAAARQITSVVVEQATSGPGEKRSTKRQ